MPVSFVLAQYNDWNLTVNPVNVNWGDTNIIITVKGPYGWQQTQTISNGPNPYTTFAISGNDIPSGTQYQICISSSALGLILPHCEYYTADGTDQTQNVSPS